MDMTALQYLSQLKRIDVIMRQKQQEIDFLRAQAEYRGQSANGDKVQTSPMGDSLADYAARIIDAERQMADDKKRLLVIRAEIVANIQALPNPIHSDILYRRYAEFKPWRRIATETGYAYDHVRGVIHRAALASMEEFLAKSKHHTQ